MAILAWILSKVSFSAVTALVGQFTQIYAKSKDDKLGALQAIVGAEQANNHEYATAVVETNRIKQASSQSIVALTIVAVFAIPAAMHAGAYSLAHTFNLGWNIPEISGFETTVLQSFLFLAPSVPLISATAQKIASKL